MSAIILDTECTGLWDPDVIELAYVPVPNLEPNQEIGDIQLHRFHPRCPITPSAMAVHNIIQDDLTMCPTWPGSWCLPEWTMQGFDSHYVIGHAIDFDMKAIGSPQGVKRICTLALSQFLWDEVESHKLGAMLYHLMPADQARGYVASAHGAGPDVQMTWLLLGFILDRAETTGILRRGATFEELWELSELARIPNRLTFGKYGPRDGNLGARYTEVDPSYLQWITRQADMDPYVVKAAHQALNSRSR